MKTCPVDDKMTGICAKYVENLGIDEKLEIRNVGRVKLMGYFSLFYPFHW